MRRQQLGLLGLFCSITQAFRDTSSLLLFSSSPLELPLAFENGQSYALSSHVDGVLRNTFSSCPSDVYIFVSEPGIRMNDLMDYPETFYHLNKRVGERQDGVISAISSLEVVGQMHFDTLQDQLKQKCGANTDEVIRDGRFFLPENKRFPQIYQVNFPALPSSQQDRISQMKQQDSFLNELLNSIHPHTYSVILVTSAQKHSEEKTAGPKKGATIQHNHAYSLFDYDFEDPFPDASHMDLKRDLGRRQVRVRASTSNSSAPLFETYSYLTPGIFMGGFVGILLLFILYIGIYAIAGLEITTAAFSKEMGPAAQKKQQQQ